jgi:hypothetical protein
VALGQQVEDMVQPNVTRFSCGRAGHKGAGRPAPILPGEPGNCKRSLDATPVPKPAAAARAQAGV